MATEAMVSMSEAWAENSGRRSRSVKTCNRTVLVMLNVVRLRITRAHVLLDNVLLEKAIFGLFPHHCNKHTYICFA